MRVWGVSTEGKGTSKESKYVWRGRYTNVAQHYVEFNVSILKIKMSNGKTGCQGWSIALAVL